MAAVPAGRRKQRTERHGQMSAQRMAGDVQPVIGIRADCRQQFAGRLGGSGGFKVGGSGTGLVEQHGACRRRRIKTADVGFKLVLCDALPVGIARALPPVDHRDELVVARAGQGDVAVRHIVAPFQGTAQCQRQVACGVFEDRCGEARVGVGVLGDDAVAGGEFLELSRSKSSVL